MPGNQDMPAADDISMEPIIPNGQVASPGDVENGDIYGNGNPSPPLRAMPRERHQTPRQRFKWFLQQNFVKVGISTVAIVFGILSLLTSWKALDIAKQTYGQGYYAFEAQKIGNRLSFMQLCALNLTKYADTCAKVDTWNYLPSVYDIVYPGGGGVPEGQPPVQLAFGAGGAAAVLGVTAGGVSVMSIAMLVLAI